MLIDTPPLNRWDKGRIAPGPVGSIGDALTSVRIKQSTPDMPIAYDKLFSAKNDSNRGSNVQDGSWASFADGGYGAEVYARKRQKKTNVGTFMQQMSGNDRSFNAVVAPQPQVGTRTQAEAILFRQGDKFQILPGGYAPEPGQLLRGGQVPRVVYNAGTVKQTMNTDGSYVRSGVNAGDNQNSVVEPIYPAAPMDSVVYPSEPIPWVENRTQRQKPGLKIITQGLPSEERVQRPRLKINTEELPSADFKRYGVKKTGSMEQMLYNQLSKREKRTPQLSVVTEVPKATGLPSPIEAGSKLYPSLPGLYPTL